MLLEQPNKRIPVYKVKPVDNGKERVLNRNMLLPLGIKFIPEVDSEIESDQEEEPEFERCQVEKQITENTPQTTDVKDMTPLAQLDVEHGQNSVSSKSEPIETPVDHVKPVEQGSMAPSLAISTGQLIDLNMSRDPELLVPIQETVGSDPTETTHLQDENFDTSLIMPYTENNINSLMETEFLDFVDDLSLEPSPLLDKEGTYQSDTAPSNKHEETLHSLVKESKPETSPSNGESSSTEAQDISNVIVPKGDSVESTDISITERFNHALL